MKKGKLPLKANSQSFPGDKPTGKVRRFVVEVTQIVTMSVDTSVLKQGMLPNGPIFKDPTDGDVLEHLAFNLISNRLRLSAIDGYANCPDTSATIDEPDIDIDIKPVLR